jgi:hypothetical protein
VGRHDKKYISSLKSLYHKIHVTSRVKGAHSGPVADLCTLEDGSFISGGLADGSIVVFDNKYELIGGHVNTSFADVKQCDFSQNNVS